MPDAPATGLAAPPAVPGSAAPDGALRSAVNRALAAPDTDAATALGCAACQGGADQPSLHTEVPLATQFLSRELIPAIVDADADPALDPRWAESGARDRAEYGYWAPRTCGLACLQMALGHYGLPVPPLVTLARQALAAGCYEPRPDGGLDGLLYHPFVDFVAERFGLTAQVETELDRPRLTSLVRDGALVIVSVHPAIRRPERAAPGRGGHLVLVTGLDGDGVHLRNPSGHDAAARAAVLAWHELEPFFAGRGVALWAPAATG
ncbi:MAG TPA: C39 family peptidase [Jatrophihabitans sp.]|nr:C39 family peptidase [Jatrophihabitans sp.]